MSEFPTNTCIFIWICCIILYAVLYYSYVVFVVIFDVISLYHVHIIIVNTVQDLLIILDYYLFASLM